MKRLIQLLQKFQAFRFILVGGIAAATDFALFGVLNGKFHWSRVAAQMISRPSGGLVSFMLNKLWTFENRDLRTVHLQALRYAVIWGCGFFGSTILMELYSRFLPVFHGRDFAAKFLAEATLGVVSFFAQRYWAFRNSKGA